MRARVVYESMFGNTHRIADAIAAGLATEGIDVEAGEVGTTAPNLDDLDLLVVGGPTHAFSLSRPQTRASAAEQAAAPVESTDIGLREWLGRLAAAPGPTFAAFDTHVDKRIPGSAAKAAHRRLRRLGLRALAAPESFHVQDVQGPLLPEELERARRWGMELARAHRARTVPGTARQG